MQRLLHVTRTQSALLKADAVELLSRMISNIRISDRDSFVEELLVNATKLRAVRCANYLQDFTRNWQQIPEMLGANASAGNLERVKIFCGADRLPAIEMIHGALKEAVSAQHLEVAAFLRTEWERRARPSYHARQRLLGDLLKALGEGSSPSVEFLTWLFSGVDDLADRWVDGMTLLDFALRERSRTMCHYLVDRGCTSLTLGRRHLALEKGDLFDFLDLCCGMAKDCHIEKDPGFELFLLRRGIQIRYTTNRDNPVIQVLQEGFEASSFANRFELIQAYLMKDATLATKTDCFRPDAYYTRYPYWVTPLGALELLGTPIITTWTGEKSIALVDSRSMIATERSDTDEWESRRPDAVEIRALRDIRETLLEHEADPQFLFAPRALITLVESGFYITSEFVKRMIHGRADMENRGWEGMTALSWMLRRRSPNKRKKLNVADILLECGADINSLDDEGKSPLFHAIAASDFETVEWLIKNGAAIPDGK